LQCNRAALVFRVLDTRGPFAIDADIQLRAFGFDFEHVPLQFGLGWALGATTLTTAPVALLRLVLVS